VSHTADKPACDDDFRNLSQLMMTVTIVKFLPSPSDA